MSMFGLQFYGLEIGSGNENNTAHIPEAGLRELEKMSILPGIRKFKGAFVFHFV